MKTREEILNDEFTRKWGNSFFGCAEGYTGEQFAQTAYPLIKKSMQTYADQECAAKDAEIAELKRRVAKLDEDQLLFHKWTCRVPTEGRTTEKLWADYQKARPYIVNELKQK